MPKSHKPYPRELKARLVAGRTPEELAERFEPTAQSVRNWVAQADRDVGRRDDGPTTDERDELRLRKLTVGTIFRKGWGILGRVKHER